ncbi:MAG: hypothetical protein J6Q24_05105 [Clostridia bacterium]|nr:hypothetical protein [Clostridia bacterium]
MLKRGKIGSYISRLTGGSRIWSRFFSGKGLTPQGEGDSLLKEDSLLESSMLGSLYKKFTHGASRVRRFCAFHAEKSRVVSITASLCRALLDTSVGSFGVFLFFTGLYSAAAFFIKLYAGSEYDVFSLIYSAVIAFSGLLLLPLRRSIITCISDGILTSYVAKEMLSVSRFALEEKRPPKKRLAWGVLFGTLAGVMGFFVSPLKVLLFLLLAAAFAVIIYSPEGGLYISLFLLPFADIRISACVALTAGVSYVFKLLIGKRNFYFTAADIFALLFALSAYIAGKITPFAYENIGITVLTVAVLYILCANLMRSSEQLYRLMSAVNSGALILALCCIFAFLFRGNLGALGDYLAQKSELVFLLPILLPAAVSTAFSRGAFSSGAIACVAIYTAAALTFSEWMYLAVIITTAIYFVFAFRKRMGIIFGAVISCAAVLVLFSTGIIDGNMVSAIPVYPSAADTAFKYLFSGVGFGDKAFTFAFKSVGYGFPINGDAYSALIIGGGLLLFILFAVMVVLLLRRGLVTLSGKASGKLKYSASAACATLCALLLCGVFGGVWNIWENVLLFSAVCGCMCGLPRIYDREAGDEI